VPAGWRVVPCGDGAAAPAGNLDWKASWRSLPGDPDYPLAEVLNLDQLNARISRLERRLKTASITLWTLSSGVVVFLLTWL
jgi:hypothetical protein